VRPLAVAEGHDPTRLSLVGPQARPARSRLVRLRARDLRGLTVGADALAVIAALTLANAVLGPVSLAVRVTVLATVIGGAILGRLYHRADLTLATAPLNDAPGLVQVVVMATLAASVTGLRGSPAVLAGFGAALLGLIVLMRALAHRLGTVIALPERCLVVGDPDRFADFARHLRITPSRAEIVALVDIATVGGEGRQFIEPLIDRHRADRVIVLADEPVDRAAQIARRSRNAGVTVTVCPRVVGTIGTDLVPELVGGSVALTAASSELGALERRLKRAFDLAGAIAALVIAAPALLAFAVAVKLTSSGPVLFWQTRVGRDGRSFRIAKFRTMVADADRLKADLIARNEAHGGLFKMTRDPRVTPVGRLLRRASLDELPQLLNVIKGDMSLVGPRPLVADEDLLIEGWHRDRLRLAPGMTGPWQVAGSARVGMNDMLMLDHHYVSNWSVWSDVKILVRTIAFVLQRRGL
jgi:exopolysaccharide biosynthesis polyprenyl glycosylphosphotransferase